MSLQTCQRPALHFRRHSRKIYVVQNGQHVSFDCRRVAVPLRGLVIGDTFPDGSLVALDGQWPKS
jgi:hypothetical protein